MEMQDNVQAQHAVLPTTTHDELARQEFVRSLKQYIVKNVAPGNRLAYEHVVQPQFQKAHKRAPRNRREVGAGLAKTAAYQTWSALLRTSQEMMWSSCQKPVERRHAEVVEQVKATEAPVGGTLKLNPRLEVPRYHTAVDIHCQPGAYHFEALPDDVAAGAVYDRAVHIYAMGQMGPYNDDMGASVVGWLRKTHPDFKPKRILDLGCSVGHSTLPYAEAFPDAEIHAIDVAAPMLRYAHARAESLGKKIHFSQQNAERTEFKDGYFDLVVSHILLHETSYKAIHNIMKECHRLLRKGGMMIHAETPQFEGMSPFDAFIFDWDTRNNNEPFWGGYHEIDLRKLTRSGGFTARSMFTALADSAFQEAQARRSQKFQCGDFGGGGQWFLYGAVK